jgi:hypothetical protein
MGMCGPKQEEVMGGWRKLKMAVFCHHGDDGGSKYFCNFGKLLPDYTALQPRRQPSSYSLP